MNFILIKFTFIFLFELTKEQECYESCETCDKKGDSEIHNCKSCKDSYYKLEDTSNCYQKNHPNYYFDLSSKKIKKCPYPCYECKYKTEPYCINCLPGYEFKSVNNECSKCNNNHYKFIYNKFDSCENNLNNKFCKKYETICVEDNNFKECPYKIPFYFNENKTCTNFEFIYDNSGNNNYRILNERFNNTIINNFIIISSNSIDEINYNTFSFLIDYDTGDLYLQNENYYFEEILLCKIKQNGREIEYKNIQGNTSFYGQENVMITINNKKYILNINKFNFSFIDFESNNTYQSSLEEMTNNDIINMESYRNILIPINKNLEEKSYLFGFINNAYFELIYYTFKTDDFKYYTKSKKTFKTIPNLKMVSCFQTKKNIIECLYINKDYNVEIILFNENFELLESIILNDNITDVNSNYFNKAILYKDEIGIYIYCYHYLEIKKLIKNTKDNKYRLKNYIPYITEKYIDIKTNNQFVNKMDLTRLSGNNFALLEMSESNSFIAFVTIFTLYNHNKYLKMRTYEINFRIYSNNYEFYDMLRAFNFNNYLGFGFSTKNPPSSGFIIIGYCNSTDPPSRKNLNDNPDFELILSNYTFIDNNIFSYILYGFKILNIPEENSGIFIASSINKNKICVNDILEKNDSIIFGFSKSSIITGEYTIEFAGITSENPNYDLIEEHAYYSKFYGKEDLKNFYKTEKFLGKTAQFIFNISNNIINNCEDNCESCLYNYKNKCLSCQSASKIIAQDKNECFSSSPGKEYYLNNSRNMFMKCHSNCDSCSQGPIYKINTYDDLISTNCDTCKSNYIKKEINGLINCIENKTCNTNFFIHKNEKICYDNDGKCPEHYPYLNTLTKECLRSCINLDSSICININRIKMSFEDYLNEIRKVIKNGTIDKILNESESGSYIIQENNITYQVTTTNNILYNISVSTIDLGECENELKDIYDIDDNKDLIILQIDFYFPDSLAPVVQYEVYHPDSKQLLNLSYCANYSINIEIPVEINEDELYIYDPKSDYYNDICNTTTSEYGTDIILNDRKQDYIDKNYSLCNDNCEYVGYNYETKQAKCECDILTEIKINLGEIKNLKIFEEFMDLSNSINIYILQCYTLLFSYIGLINNLGNYFILSIIILYICVIIYFYIKDIFQIKGIIDNILAYKRIKNFERNSKFEISKSNIMLKNKEKLNLSRDISSSPPKKKGNKEIESHKNSTNIRINMPCINIYKIKNNKERFKNKKNKKSLNKIKMNNKFKMNNVKKINIDNPELVEDFKIIDKKHKKYELLKLNDCELNALDYKEAIEFDKRTFLQYYWSLLKNNELFLFAFCPNIDYNSRIIKIFFFFFSFSLSLTLNALFFNDSTMHKIYINKGNYTFISRLPQIIISSLITSLINITIKGLSLSQKDIIYIKREKDIHFTIKKSRKTYKSLKIKFIIFFLWSFILLLFFWYYLGCFCAVYKNTQIYLLKDTFTSFLITLSYPFFTYLIIAILRIVALRDEKHSLKCIYKITSFF